MNHYTAEMHKKGTARSKTHGFLLFRFWGVLKVGICRECGQLRLSLDNNYPNLFELIRRSTRSDISKRRVKEVRTALLNDNLYPLKISTCSKEISLDFGCQEWVRRNDCG